MADGLVMYIVINEHIKINSQASPVIVNMVSKLLSDDPLLWREYTKNGVHPKIFLHATVEEMEDLIKKYPCCWRRDVGRTQVSDGTLTAIAFPPVIKSRAPQELFKLL